MQSRTSDGSAFHVMGPVERKLRSSKLTVFINDSSSFRLAADQAQSTSTRNSCQRYTSILEICESCSIETKAT